MWGEGGGGVEGNSQEQLGKSPDQLGPHPESNGDIEIVIAPNGESSRNYCSVWGKKVPKQWKTSPNHMNWLQQTEVIFRNKKSMFEGARPFLSDLYRQKKTSEG